MTWVKDANAAEFIKKALDYAQTDTNGKKPGEKDYDSTKVKISPVRTVTATSADIEFTGLKLGYYLIDTTLGSLCSLDATDPEVVMEEKNQVPKNYKRVKEDSGVDNWRGTELNSGENDADIGQTIEFRSIITVYPGTDNLIFHDQMPEGLTFTQADADNITVYIDNKTEPLAKGSEYTVEFVPGTTVPHISQDIAGNCTFHIRFADSVFEKLSGDGTNTLTISYSATLNEKAVIGVPGNINKSQVSYGDKFHATPVSQTITRTYGFKVFKYKKGTTEGLSNTKFELHSNNDGAPGDAIRLIKTTTGTAGQADEYRVAMSTKGADGTVTYEAGAVTEIITNDSGRFTINGLDADTYYLVETASRPGYNKLKNPVVVDISYENGTVKLKKDNKEVTGDTIEIENGTGTELPETGGIGTTIFYIAGSILLIGAAVLLIAKKRMDNEK